MNTQVRLPAARAVAAIAVMALVVAIVLEIGVLRTHQRLESSRREALAVAQAQVVDLTSIDAANIDRRIASMRKRTTGDFRRQLQGMTQTFAEVVRRGKVTARGDVVAAAVTSVTDRRAHVLVANRTRLTNGTDKKPTTRAYRLRVDLRRVDHRWLVSGMEFVQ